MIKNVNVCFVKTGIQKKEIDEPVKKSLPDKYRNMANARSDKDILSKIIIYDVCIIQPQNFTGNKTSYIAEIQNDPQKYSPILLKNAQSGQTT